MLTFEGKTCLLFRSITTSVPYQALVRSIQQGEKMDAIVELLKIIVGLLILVGIIRYWMNGLPPRGKGRRRGALSYSETGDPPDSSRRGPWSTRSAPHR